MSTPDLPVVRAADLTIADAADRTAGAAGAPTVWRTRRAVAAILALLAASIAIALWWWDAFWTGGEGDAVLGAAAGIGLWRYGWWLTQIVRARIFLRHVFPRRRAAADAAARVGKVPHIYVVVSSYDIPEEQTARVYGALIANCVSYGAPATILASVTSARDEGTIRDVYDSTGAPARIQVVVKFQLGDGKRSALGFALRSIARRQPDDDALVVLVDGDVVLDALAFDKCAPLFLADPELRALTTNNDAMVTDRWPVRPWFALRHAQRHVLMASMALSERLLVLTGRFSVFRAGDAVSREFIDLVERDGMRHWRLGEFAFVSGDDKSTWYYVLKNRGKMLYVPDVKAVSFEGLPGGASFVAGATQLMLRWYGNMMRANAKGIRLGPGVCGPFTWWSLVDQRISMWTSLVGPTAALLLAFHGMVIAPVFYLVWVVLTRSAMSLIDGLFWGRAHASWPFLMFFNQIWGAWLRIHVLFRLDRQGWTRQGVGRSGHARGAVAFSSLLLHATALLAFVALIASALRLLPDFSQHVIPALRLLVTR